MTATAFNGSDRIPLARGQILGALHHVAHALLGGKLKAQVELISSNGFCGMTDTLGATKSLRGITPQKNPPLSIQQQERVSESTQTEAIASPCLQIGGESAGLLESEVGECFGLFTCWSYQEEQSRLATTRRGVGGLLRLHCGMLSGW